MSWMKMLEILAMAVPLVLAIVFHEVAHGLVARALGDPTASQARRLSLNPLRHVDPVGTVVLPLLLLLLLLLLVVVPRLFHGFDPVRAAVMAVFNPLEGLMVHLGVWVSGV